VLEFDQFMKIEGCKTKDRHLFVGSGKKEKESSTGGEEVLETVRYVELPCQLGTLFLPLRFTWARLTATEQYHLVAEYPYLVILLLSVEAESRRSAPYLE
jgi:hypothetical protein